METKVFGGKEIIVRPLSQEDVLRPGLFRDFINSLVREKAQILENKNWDVRQAKEYLRGKLKEVKGKKTVFLLAEQAKKLVARVEIYLLSGSKDHIGILRVMVRKGWRQMGLGSYLLQKSLQLARTKLRPRPKMISLTIQAGNKPAEKLYQKFGFKQVARLPRQCQYQGRLIDEIIMILEL